MKERTALLDVRYLSVSIAHPRSVVYAFASNPANAPAWASGLAPPRRSELHPVLGAPQITVARGLCSRSPGRRHL
jgi:hypothetical protein